MTAADSFMPDGDGLYDILFDLPPPPGSQSKRFNAGEDLVYEISGIASLTASSFNFFSQPGAGGPGMAGPFLAAAFIQSTGPGGLDSDFEGAIPEPSSLSLAALGLLSLLAYRWRRRRRS